MNESNTSEELGRLDANVLTAASIGPHTTERTAMALWNS